MLSLLLVLVGTPSLSFAQAGAYDIGSAGNGIPIVIPYGPPPVSGNPSPAVTPSPAVIPSSAVTPSPAATPEPSVPSALNTPSAGSDTANAYTILNSALQTYASLAFPTSFPVLPPPATATSVSAFPTMAMPNPSAAGTEPGQTQSSPPASGTATLVPPIILSTSSKTTLSMTPAGSATTARPLSPTLIPSVAQTATGVVFPSGSIFSTMVTGTTRTESSTGLSSILSTMSTASSSMPGGTSSGLVSSTFTTITTTTINNNGPSQTSSEPVTSMNNGINPGVQPATTTAAPPAATGGVVSSRGFPATAGSLLALLLVFSVL